MKLKFAYTNTFHKKVTGYLSAPIFLALFTLVSCFWINPTSGFSNIPPVTVNESIQLCEGSSFTGMVFNGDYDPEGTALSVSPIPVSYPSNGTFSLDLNGSFTYTPFAGFSGTDLVIVSICDQDPMAPACTNDTIFILVDALITAFVPDIETCSVSTFVLSGNDPSPGTGNWTFVSGPSVPVLTPLAGYSIQADGLVADPIPYLFEYTIVNGTCNSSDQVSLFNYLPPSTSFAGFDIYECLSAPASINLEANEPLIGTGQWTLIFGQGNITINNPSDPNTLVTGLEEGLTLFDWTITNGVCEASSSAAFVQITQPPVAFAGQDTTLCPLLSGYFLSSATASAYQTLSWSSSGSGSFNNAATLNPTYFPSAEDISMGSVILSLSALGNLSCPETTDDIILNFEADAWVNAGTDDSISSSQTNYTIAGASASIGITVNWTSSGDGYFDDPSLINPTYFIGSTDLTTGSVVLTIEVSGASACPGEPDSMTLSFISALSADAGPDAYTCNEPFTITEATAMNFSSITWSHNGLGTLANSTGISPTYYPFPQESGPVVLTLKVFGMVPSNDSIVDQMTLTITTPSAKLSGDAEICSGETVALRIDLTGNAPWNCILTNGVDQIILENIPASPYFVHVSPVADQSVYTLVSCTDAQCFATSEQLQGSAIIKVNPLPLSGFAVDGHCAGEPVNFTDLSATGFLHSIVEWNWNFGDPASGAGNSSNLQNPVHSFSSSGNYHVLLNVKNDAGCLSDTSMTITVYEMPDATFSVSVSDDGTTVSFIAPGPGDPATTYYWNFGDGIAQMLIFPDSTVTHRYSEAGVYTATLEISGGNGCSAIKNLEIVTYQAPRITIMVSDSLICQHDAITVSLSSSGTIEEWWLDWGDGTAPVVEHSPQPTKMHNYREPGNYVIKVKGIALSPTRYTADSAICRIIVSPSPIADFISMNHCPGDSTEFHLAPVANLSGEVTCQWNFGDPASATDYSTDNNPVYHYRLPGNYFAELILKDRFGCSDTIIRQVIINKPPVADFSSGPSCPDQPTQFFDHSNSSHSVISTWHWTAETENGFMDAMTSNPSFTFNTPGNVLVRLRVTDSNGCSDSTESLFTIGNRPVSVFTIEENAGFEQGRVALHNGSIGGVHYEWDFGNGESSDERSPAITFDEDGYYKIRLTVTNSSGCQDTSTMIYHQFYKSLFVPNAFAPESLAMPGTLWKPAGENLSSYNIEIYDRWGILIWSSDKLDADGSPMEGWDGTYQGVPCQKGVYIWKISARFGDGSIWKNEDIGSRSNMPNLTTGTITLIR